MMSTEQLFIRTVTGKTLALDVNLKHDNVNDLSQQILSYTAIDPKHQILTHSGKLLQSHRSLKYYKIKPFDTIDLSLKLLSSKTSIMVKREKETQNIDGTDIPKEQSISFNPRTTLKDIRMQSKVPYDTYFVHNHKILKNENIRVQEIDNLWTDLTLHTTIGNKTFGEAEYVSFKLFNKASSPVFITDYRRQQSLETIIFDFFRSISFDSKFYSGEIGFKSIGIRFGKYKYDLPLISLYKSIKMDQIDRIDRSGGTNKNPIFGLIPSDVTLCSLANHFSNCDCCTHPSTSIESKRTSEDTIIIQIELPSEPFIFQKKWYYANAKFYRRHKQKPKDFIDLQLFSIICNKKEQLLVHGYMRFIIKMKDIPMDVVSLINSFFPSLYGGRYDVDMHNKDLMNKLQQKTNVFGINDIDFHLKYGQIQEENEEIGGKNEYFLVLNFEKQNDVTVLYILCRIYCKNTLQSYTFINFVDCSSSLHHIHLPDFGHKTSLSSLVCDVQIINMLSTSGEIYEYPSRLTRNLYLLEWTIHGTLLQNIKNCISNGLQQSYESEIFYNLFRLRCYPNENGAFLIAVQLVSLPSNRIHRDKLDGLNVHCKVFETETKRSCEFYESLGFGDDSSAFCAKFLRNNQKMMQHSWLCFRVLIEIMDPLHLPSNIYDRIQAQTRNYHRGDLARASFPSLSPVMMATEQLFIKTITGKTLALDVDLTHDNVNDLSQKISMCENIDTSQQILTHSGKLLQSHRSLKYYNIKPFDTIDLSFALRSSQTKITVKMEKGTQDVDGADIAQIQTISFNPRTTLKDIRKQSKIPSNIFFVHNNKILKNELIRVQEIDNFWADLTLHTKLNDNMVFGEARDISFEFCGKQSEPVLICEQESTDVDKLIYAFLRSIFFDSKFYSGQSGFKSIAICFGKYKYDLPLDNEQYKLDQVQKLDESRMDKDPSLGLIPSNVTLRSLAKYFPNCDCCTHPSMSIESLSTSEDTIVIKIELPNEPFIFQKKWYYANAKFYPRYEKIQKDVIDLQLFPIIDMKKEQLLVHGFMRCVVEMNEYYIPVEVVSLISSVFPSLYGGRYAVDEHNDCLIDKLQQQTNAFRINNIDFYLKYGRMEEGQENEREDNEYPENNEYFLVLNYEKQRDVSVLYFLCRVYCKNTLQSYTFIEWFNFSETDESGDPLSPIAWVQLPDFGDMTTLSSLVCDVQIINMLSISGQVYEYPSTLTRNVYLLEWTIDGDMLKNMHNCINNGLRQSFESEIFYNLFRLRCYPNENGAFMIAVQLVTLPVNRQCKEEFDELWLRCNVFERGLWCQFSAKLDYDDSSAFCAKLEKFNIVSRICLNFQVLIEILDPQETDIDDPMATQTKNYHRGDLIRGIDD